MEMLCCGSFIFHILLVAQLGHRVTQTKNDLTNTNMFEDDYLCFKDRASINNWCIAISNYIAASKRDVVIRLNLESYVHDGNSSITRLLQMSLLAEKTAVINLSLVKAFSEEYFPRNLKLLLENKKLICV